MEKIKVIAKARRIVFLLNEQLQENDNCDDDVRALYHRIAYLFYGLSHITSSADCQCWYSELKEEDVKDFFNSAPCAIIACTNEPDDGAIDKELGILNPNIIVCCRSEQYDFVKNLYGKDNLIGFGYGKKNDLKLQYEPNKNVVIMFIGHQDFLKIADNEEEYYNKVLDNFRFFVYFSYGKRFIGEL